MAKHIPTEIQVTSLLQRHNTGNISIMSLQTSVVVVSKSTCLCWIMSIKGGTRQSYAVTWYCIKTFDYIALGAENGSISEW